MVNEKIKILILDDEKDFTEELNEFLTVSGLEVFEANSGEDGLQILSEQEMDLMILDVRLGNMNGLTLLTQVRTMYPKMEVIIVSGHGDMDTVINAMRLGAIDYLRKPFRHIDIRIAIERTQKYIYLQKRLICMEEKNSLISKSLEDKIERQFIGISDQLLEVLEAAMTAAKYPDVNVLITGESGTGKENIAKIIHFSGSRKDYTFCAVNGSAISESLLESEFFGHKKGSFTGAFEDKVGYFEACNKGTMFLDEIADMPYHLQAKILRATEEKVITKVGDTKQIQTDFRIISATNHDIYKKVENKEFRLDLLHRLNTLHIHIPPLREHPEDIKPLIEHYAEFYAIHLKKPYLRINQDVFDFLYNYEFPGNVRELRNMTERAIIFCKTNELHAEDFSGKYSNGLSNKSEKIKIPASITNSPKEESVIHEMELIRRILKEQNFNQSSSAKILGISRDTLIRKMKKFNIVVLKSE